MRAAGLVASGNTGDRDMSTKAPYCVTGLDKEGFCLSTSDDFSNLKSAKSAMREMIKEKELVSAGLHKVEVTDMHKTVQADAFVVRS